MSKTRIEQYPNSMLTVGQMLAEEQFKELPENDKIREMNRIERELFYQNKEKYKDNVDNFLNKLIKVDGYLVELTQYLNISAEEFMDDLTREKINQKINNDMIKRIKEINILYPKGEGNEDNVDRMIKGAGLKGGVISEDDYINLEKRTNAELKAMLKDRGIPVTIKKDGKRAQYTNQAEAISLLRQYQNAQTEKIVGKVKVKKVKVQKAATAEEKVKVAQGKLRKAEINATKAEDDVRTLGEELNKITAEIEKLKTSKTPNKPKTLISIQLLEARAQTLDKRIKAAIVKAQQIVPLEVAEALDEVRQAEREVIGVDQEAIAAEPAEEAFAAFEEEQAEDEDLKIEDIARDDLEYTFVLTLLTKILDEITNINLEYKTNIINKSKFISLFDIETILIELKDLRKRWDELASSFRFYPSMPVDKINDRINKEFIKLIELTKTLDPSFTITAPNLTSLSDSISDRLNSSIISQKLQEALKRIPPI